MMNKWGCFGLVFLFAVCLSAEAHIDVTAQQAYTMLQNDPNLIVVDVREESEYCGTLGHVPGAYNYPYNSGVLQNRYTDFNPNESIMLICQSGSRSNNAANYLDSKGFSQIYDILGGTSTWDNYYSTVGCVDTDKDGFNDDLDNYPEAFNPTQAGRVWLGDLAEFAAYWQADETFGLILEDLISFCQHWLNEIP